jgi:hypothetical protein
MELGKCRIIEQGEFRLSHHRNSDGKIFVCLTASPRKDKNHWVAFAGQPEVLLITVTDAKPAG